MRRWAWRERIRSPDLWPIWAHYVLALGAVGGALWVRWLLEPVFAGRAAYGTVLVALMPLALVVRPGAFLVGGVLGLFGVWFLIIQPPGSLRDTSSLTQLSLFTVMTIVCGLTAALSRHVHRKTRLKAHDAAAKARLLDLTQDAVVVTDMQGRVTYWNRGAQELYGWAADEVMGKPLHELVRTEFPLPIDRVMQQVEAQGRWTGEVVQYSRTRRRMHIATRCALEVDARGRPFSILAINSDISDRKRAEAALRDSEARHRAVFETAVSGIITFDEHGIIESVNPSAERIFGYAASELVGRSIGMLAPSIQEGDFASEREAGLRRIVGLGRDVVGRRKDGTEVALDLGVAEVMLQDAAGRPARRMFTALVRDISDRKRYEAELQAYQHRLEERVEERTAELRAAHERLRLTDRMAAVGALAAGLAHDMKNVLLPLSARLEAALAEPGLSGQVREDLRAVAGLLDHLREMARNLSLFARDPEQEGTAGRTHLADWMRRVRGFLEASVGSLGVGKSIRFDWSIPDGLPEVTVAPHRLTQAVLNLVHNARDAIWAKRSSLGDASWGVISIRATPEPDTTHITLEVRDDGCGMSEEVRKQCIEPFFTTKSRAGRPGGEHAGSGLGMSLAYTIAQRAGGKMDIESEPGNGTTVRLVLPCAQRAASAASRTGQAWVSIEDKRIRAVVMEVLRTLHYEAVDDPKRETSTLWVTDANVKEPKDAAAFLRGSPERHVVALGGDEQWKAVGADVCERTQAAATVRRVLMGK